MSDRIKTNFKVLIVDDNHLHAEMMVEKIKSFNPYNVDFVTSYDEAIHYLTDYLPDVLILDHFLDQDYTSIDIMTNRILRPHTQIIVTSTFYNQEVFSEILAHHPIAFVNKEAPSFEFEKAIVLANQRQEEKSLKTEIGMIFARVGNKVKSIDVDEIEMVHLNNKYLTIYLGDKSYVLKSTLREFLSMVGDNFVQVHQSYAINVKFVDHLNLDDNKAVLTNYTVPISRNAKSNILKYFKIL